MNISVLAVVAREVVQVFLQLEGESGRAMGVDGGGETHRRANKRRAAGEGERMKAGG